MGSEERSTTKPLTGTVFYVLLALADGQRYGLGIVQEIDRRTAGDVQLGPGTLYNAIKKMLATGLIEETHTPNDPLDEDHCASRPPARDSWISRSCSSQSGSAASVPWCS